MLALSRFLVFRRSCTIRRHKSANQQGLLDVSTPKLRTASLFTCLCLTLSLFPPTSHADTDDIDGPGWDAHLKVMGDAMTRFNKGEKAVINSAVLANAYKQNEVSADNMFKGKYWFIVGPVERVFRARNGEPTLWISGTPTSHILIRPYAVTPYPKDAQSFFPLKTSKLYGTISKGEQMVSFCRGAGGDSMEIVVDDCMVMTYDDFEGMFLHGNKGPSN
ncbi:hypothetical protein [Pseudomonas sp. NPDC007930]|uniref:hypothetical protein n=1 Tax=Pseudomonas sp. NPDC007930 TaxID=3364417 RepID=UPI0036E63DE9